MARHDVHYKSFFGYFKDLRDRYQDADGDSPNEYYCDPDMPSSQDGENIRAQLKGGIEPISDIGKDFKDAFLRYKRFFDIARDFVQPLHGISNVFYGAVIVIATPLVFLVRTFADLKHYFQARKEYYSDPVWAREAPPKYPKHNLTETASWLLEGISKIIRGLTQIATTPLAWIKVIVMGGITAFKGFRKIEDDPGFKRNLEIAVNNSGHEQINALITLHYKFKRGFAEGRATPSKRDDIKCAEKAAYKQFIQEKSSEEKRKQYISFFQKSACSENTETAEPKNATAAKAPQDTL